MRSNAAGARSRSRRRNSSRYSTFSHRSLKSSEYHQERLRRSRYTLLELFAAEFVAEVVAQVVIEKFAAVGRVAVERVGLAERVVQSRVERAGGDERAEGGNGFDERQVA